MKKKLHAKIKAADVAVHKADQEEASAHSKSSAAKADEAKISQSIKKAQANEAKQHKIDEAKLKVEKDDVKKAVSKAKAHMAKKANQIINAEKHENKEEVDHLKTQVRHANQTSQNLEHKVINTVKSA